MEIDYYEATSLDAKDIIEYLNVIASQTNNLTFGKNELEINELQEMQLINEIHNSINSVMILAKDGNKIVGMVSLSGESKARIKHRSNLGISVLKEYWHQGIGSSLLAAAIGYAVENDIEIIELEVITTNKNAIKLYEKFGFETIGIYENYFKIDDEYYDAQLMNLYL